MGKGYVSAMSLLDIANAIRVQGGSETHYKPADMAAAVAASPARKTEETMRPARRPSCREPASRMQSRTRCLCQARAFN